MFQWEWIMLFPVVLLVLIVAPLIHFFINIRQVLTTLTIPYLSGIGPISIRQLTIQAALSLWQLQMQLRFQACELVLLVSHVCSLQLIANTRMGDDV